QEGIRGANPDDTYGQQMAPMAAMLSTPEAIRNVAAYIAQLPETRSSTTISGNLDTGRVIYNDNCAACHGRDGRGSWATDAPNLVGMDDWYAARQINNFKTRIRGSHRDDDYGEQMISMVSAMRSEQQVNDLISYLNSLR